MSDAKEISQEYIKKVLESKNTEELIELTNNLLVDRNYDRKMIISLELRVENLSQNGETK